MPRTGFSCKQAAEILGIDPRRVTQALDPAAEKFGKLWNADPTATMRIILEWAERVRDISDEELEQRIAMQRNRIDRDVVHPRRGGR